MANLSYIASITEPNNTTTEYRFFLHESLGDVYSILGFQTEDPAAPNRQAKKAPIKQLLNENALRKIRLGYRDANKKLKYRLVYCVGANVASALSGAIGKQIKISDDTSHTIVTTGIKTHTRLG